MMSDHDMIANWARGAIEADKEGDKYARTPFAETQNVGAKKKRGRKGYPTRAKKVVKKDG